MHPRSTPDRDAASAAFHKASADRFEGAYRGHAAADVRFREVELIAMYYSCFHRLQQMLHLQGDRDWLRAKHAPGRAPDPEDFTHDHNLLSGFASGTFPRIRTAWPALTNRMHEVRYRNGIVPARNMPTFEGYFEGIQMELQDQIAAEHDMIARGIPAPAQR